MAACYSKWLVQFDEQGCLNKVLTVDSLESPFQPVVVFKHKSKTYKVNLVQNDVLYCRYNKTVKMETCFSVNNPVMRRAIDKFND